MLRTDGSHPNRPEVQRQQPQLPQSTISTFSIIMMEIDKIYNMDCLEGMKQIPDGSVDLVATDPPYKLTSRGSSGTMSGYWATDIARKGKVFEHNDIEIEEYLPEFYRILKPDAHCYIMCNNLNLPHFFEVISKSKFNFIKLLGIRTQPFAANTTWDRWSTSSSSVRAKTNQSMTAECPTCFQYHCKGTKTKRATISMIAKSPKCSSKY